jgi:transposase
MPPPFTVPLAMADGSQFNDAQEFAMWLGLTPRQSSSGDSFKSVGITKRGNRYLRKQLVHGARAMLSRSKNKTDSLSLWANQLVARRGIQKACVAMAARMARIAWTLLQRKEMYKEIHKEKP